MKSTLTDNEKEMILPHIQRVLDTGESWEGEFMHFPAGALIDAVLSIPDMKKDESDEDLSEGFATNGWQYDWWQQFTHAGKKYTLGGSGYYGGHAFHLSDE